ncbi:MAG TPA: hypothetical protein VHH32_01810 [Gemmatimonadales bacterium]|nr:hypothetical protein [Gemmatimonadales bacterium]
MSEGVPARIDRAALERIIHRAAELQTAEREIGDTLSSDELIALGREVGIPVRYLQQALLEERTSIGVRSAPGIIDRVAGPGEISAQRVVSLESEMAEQGLLHWMERNELFCVQRQQRGRITWEPLSGFQAAIRRSAAALGAGKRPFMLSRAATVTATILPLESGYSHVALVADTRKIRNEYLAGSATLAGAGAAGAAIMVALGALLPVALLPLPFAVGGAYAALRRYGPAIARIQLGLERALDSLEHGAPGPSRRLEARAGLIDLLADEVRRALKP